MTSILTLWRIHGAALFVWVLSVTNVAAQSDGMCFDRRSDCVSLARMGFCQANPKDMFDACPVTCRFCLPVPQPNVIPIPVGNNDALSEATCFDKDVDCRSWARHGLCQSHLMQMKQLCPDSCNFCMQAPRQPMRTIANPDFACGQPYPRKTEGKRVRIGRQIQRTPQNTNFGAPPQGNMGSSVFPNRDIGARDTICGATVISQRFLLTAAHCVLDPNRPVRTVRVGELDFSRENEANSRPVDYEIEKIIVHPNYNPNMQERYNDVALLQTVIPIEFNDVVYPMCLSTFKPPSNTLVTASGFGKLNATSQSSILQEGALNVVSNSECEASYRQNGLESLLKGWYPSLLQNRDVLCAGHPGRGTCKEDAGGPLFYEDRNGRRFLVGVSSIGLACKGTKFANLPGVYISVADHIPFIDSVLYGF